MSKALLERLKKHEKFGTWGEGCSHFIELSAEEVIKLLGMDDEQAWLDAYNAALPSAIGYAERTGSSNIGQHSSEVAYQHANKAIAALHLRRVHREIQLCPQCQHRKKGHTAQAAESGVEFHECEHKDCDCVEDFSDELPSAKGQ